MYPVPALVQRTPAHAVPPPGVADLVGNSQADLSPPGGFDMDKRARLENRAFIQVCSVNRRSSLHGGLRKRLVVKILQPHDKHLDIVVDARDIAFGRPVYKFGA